MTPDSFSDGGRWFDTTAAVKHGLDLVAEGADLVDVGGESTRPGATPGRRGRGAAARRPRRPGPGRRGRHRLRRHHARLGRRAGGRGRARVLVNDVSGGLADPAMVPAVAAAGGALRRDALARLQRGHEQPGGVRGRRRRGRRRAARAHGRGRRGRHRPRADRRRPGPRLRQGGRARPRAGRPSRPRCARLGRPLLVAASRKRFLGRVLAGTEGAPPPARERDAATAAVSAIAAHEGAWAVRVHEVRATRGRRAGRPRHRREAARRGRGARGRSTVSFPYRRRAVELANTAFYEAMERGDFDGGSLGSPLAGRRRGVPSDVSCVHPGWPVLPAAARCSARTR